MIGHLYWETSKRRQLNEVECLKKGGWSVRKMDINGWFVRVCRVNACAVAIEVGKQGKLGVRVSIPFLAVLTSHLFPLPGLAADL